MSVLDNLFLAHWNPCRSSTYTF